MRMSTREFEAFRRRYFEGWASTGISIPIELARHLVLGAAEYAGGLGFEPHRDLIRARGVGGAEREHVRPRWDAVLQERILRRPRARARHARSHSGAGGYRYTVELGEPDDLGEGYRYTYTITDQDEFGETA